MKQIIYLLNGLHVGIQNTTNYDNGDLFNQDYLINLYLEGETSINENENNEKIETITYSLKGINQNNQIKDLTQFCSFTIYPNNICTLNNNKIIIPTNINKDTICTLKANLIYHNKAYSTSLAILLKKTQTPQAPNKKF